MDYLVLFFIKFLSLLVHLQSLLPVFCGKCSAEKGNSHVLRINVNVHKHLQQIY